MCLPCWLYTDIDLEDEPPAKKPENRDDQVAIAVSYAVEISFLVE
jgi:hypothetical protein